MAKLKLVALTTPIEGREAEYHDWYQNTHLHELCAIPGVKSAQRYQLVTKMIGADTNPWMAIYDIECDDPMQFLQAVGQASASGKMTPGTASDMAVSYTALFAEYGEPVIAKGA